MSTNLDYDWTDEAACRGMDTRAWFPEDNRILDGPANRAVSICMGCPVRRQCAEMALSIPDGIWGGATPAQRQTARRVAPSDPIEHLLAATRRAAEKRGIVAPGGSDA